jgi:hypothetical protein
MELGQLAFGNPTGEYDMPTYATALVEFLKEEIERVYWNKNQEEWDGGDPKIPGIQWNPYYWGDDEAEKEKPNLKFDFSKQEGMGTRRLGGMVRRGTESNKQIG